MRPEQKLAKLLSKKRKSLAVAESCTGGLVTHRLTNIPGSSKFFTLGVVAYANEAKIKILRIPPSILRNFGAVSSQTALTMAQNMRKLSKSDYALSITGIAGPTGGTKQKPVGLVYIALASKKHTLWRQCIFKGTRHQIKTQAATSALELLLKNA